MKIKDKFIKRNHHPFDVVKEIVNTYEDFTSEFMNEKITINPTNCHQLKETDYDQWPGSREIL